MVIIPYLKFIEEVIKTSERVVTLCSLFSCNFTIEIVLIKFSS